MPTFACPICGKTVTVTVTSEAPYRPFCSDRCKRVDLGRWLSEEYKISEPIPGGQASKSDPDRAEADHDPDGDA